MKFEKLGVLVSKEFCDLGKLQKPEYCKSESLLDAATGQLTGAGLENPSCHKGLYY